MKYIINTSGDNNCTWRFLRDCGSADMPIPLATFLLFVGVPDEASWKYSII